MSAEPSEYDNKGTVNLTSSNRTENNTNIREIDKPSSLLLYNKDRPTTVPTIVTLVKDILSSTTDRAELKGYARDVFSADFKAPSKLETVHFDDTYSSLESTSNEVNTQILG